MLERNLDPLEVCESCTMETEYIKDGLCWQCREDARAEELIDQYMDEKE